jgi:orotidine-5'-phosphate decarboxylase
VTTTAEVLEIVRRVGPSVCMVKVGWDRSSYLHVAFAEDCSVGGCGRWITAHRADTLRCHR